MKWRSAAVGITVALGACLVLAPGVVALVIPATVGVLLLVTLVRWLNPTPTGEIDNRLMGWTIGAFVAHLLLGLLITNWSAATNYLGADAQTYHGGAIQLAQSWLHHSPTPQLPIGKEGFFYELGGLYYLFGPHWAAGLAFNAAAAAALVPILTDVTRRLFGADAARYAAPLVVLIPGFLIWTSQLLREASVLFLIAVAVDLAIRLTERLQVLTLAALASTLALLFTFRANVAYVLVGSLVIGLAVSRRRIVAGVSISAATLSLCAVLVTSAGLGYAGYRRAAGADLKQVNVVRLDSSGSAASGFAPSADVSTPGHAIAYLPQGLPAFLLGPFPWQVSGPRQLPALLDVVVLWALIPSLWRGFVATRRRDLRPAYILLIPAAILAAMLSLLVANFGTLVRERMQVVVLLVPFVAVGLSLRAAALRGTQFQPAVRSELLPPAVS